MFKTRQLHLVKEDWAWNEKKPWCNYRWEDNETPRHSYPAFCEHGHATTVCAKDLDVHVTCEACAAMCPDFPGIMIGLSGMVKDVQFDDDAATQFVLSMQRYDKYFLFTSNLGWLDSLIKERDAKTNKPAEEKMYTGTAINRLLSALFDLGRLCAITGGPENREVYLLIDEIRRKISAVNDELCERRNKEKKNA